MPYMIADEGGGGGGGCPTGLRNEAVSLDVAVLGDERSTNLLMHYLEPERARTLFTATRGSVLLKVNGQPGVCGRGWED